MPPATLVKVAGHRRTIKEPFHTSKLQADLDEHHDPPLGILRLLGHTSDARPQAHPHQRHSSPASGGQLSGLSATLSIPPLQNTHTSTGPAGSGH